MGTSAGSYLRQMRDTDNLAVAIAHFLHNIRHAVGYLTGHSRIYFIEHDSGQLHRSGYHCLDRQHDTGYLAPRSYRRNILQSPVLVGREKEVHRIRPLCTRLLACTYFHLKTDIGHAQRYQTGCHLLFNLAGCGGTQSGKYRCLPLHLII